MSKCKTLNNFINIICIQIFIIGILRAQTEVLYDEGARRLEANAGPDIHAPAFSTIMLDASRSVHSKGSLLRYEWLLPPSLVFYDDYAYANSDTVKTHDEPNTYPETSKGKSWKSISTKSKYIEIDLPENPEGTTLPVILKVMDPLGFVDTDTLMVIFTELRTRPNPIDLAVADTTATEETAAAEEVKPEKELVDTGKPSFLISIQPLNRGELYPMESEMISSFLYNEILDMGVYQVLDPNRFIPDSITVQELVRQTKIVADTVIVTRQAAADTNSEAMDTTMIGISDTTITIDTLEYDQLVESVLYYNFDCRTDSCASENAKIENASHVLSWGFNRFSELEIHYFDVEKYAGRNPVFTWTVSPVSMDPEAVQKIRYPTAFAVTEDNTLIIATANSQAVYELNIDQQASMVSDGILLGKALVYPSGVAVDSTGRIYIADKDHHRVYSILKEQATRLLVPKMDKDGSLDTNQPLLPTSVRIGPGGNIYVLYESNSAVLKVEPSNKVFIALQPGLVEGAQDIAINSRDTLFVVSSNEHKVYRVENDSTLTAVAGTKSGDKLVRNNVPAVQSYLGNPVAIDFDSQDNLYIADRRFGLVRRINKGGTIITLAGISKKIEDMTQLRVSPGENPEIYVTQDLQHAIQRIVLEERIPWWADTTILHPKYTIAEAGIYGLEPDLRAAVNAVLRKKAPKKKTTLGDRSRELNLRMMAFIGQHPFLFALLLLLLNQVLFSGLDGGAGITDLPPDFPF